MAHEKDTREESGDVSVHGSRRRICHSATLGGGGRLTATYQLSTDPDLITRVIAEHPAAELPDRRDETTRVWEIIREVETTHPDGSETTDVVASYVIEKGSGLCYRDGQGNLLPASPRWVESGGGFAVTECAYGVSAGTTLATPLSYVVKGRELALRPAHLMASDGSADWHVAELDMDAAGALDPLRPNVLTFVRAFGEGIDVEFVAEKGALHQNLIIRNPLPQVFPGARIYFYTEIGLSDFARGCSGRITIAGQEVPAADPLLSAAAGPKYPIVFSVPDASAGGYEPLHSFDQSPVTDSSQTAEHSPLDFAERTLLRDAAVGIDYLVESIPASSLDTATYPVVWDWVNVPQSPVSGTWEPRYTYHITSTCSVAPGQTLTILPGTTVKFGAVNKLTVPASAKLVAKGEPYNYITFTSWKDDNSGEDLTPGQSTSGAPGDYGAAVEIQYQASPDCVVQYVKMGYGVNGILTEQSIEPIRHNIIRDFSYAGIYLYFCDTDCQNNLIARNQGIGTGGTGIYCVSLASFDLSNNAIDWCSTGIYTPGSSGPTVTDNLLTEYDIGIYGPSGLHPDYNAYYSTRPGHQDTAGGCSHGLHDVALAATPYDTSLAGTLGGHYLNEGGVAALKDGGSKPAAEAALDAEVFAIRKPKSPPATINFKERWSKVCYDSDGAPYSLDLGTVCIGYHHNRIDWHLTSDVTVTGSAGSLSIAPGVVVTMYWSSTEGRYLRAASGGKIVCEGMRRSPEYILLTRSKPASMKIESVRYGDSVRGFVKIESTASANCRVGFTKFQWSSALMLYKSLTNPMESNIFNLSYGGIVTSDCQNHYLNNVVHWNLVNGLQTTRGSTTITNCTFD
ncbi:MAG: right-handed parallel beta-helix repeat-containing protein, partial [bacterium]|nr:right-handed parallel beta-helix repeat-containing protein [bacterium]